MTRDDIIRWAYYAPRVKVIDRKAWLSGSLNPRRSFPAIRDLRMHLEGLFSRDRPLFPNIRRYKHHIPICVGGVRPLPLSDLLGPALQELEVSSSGPAHNSYFPSKEDSYGFICNHVMNPLQHFFQLTHLNTDRWTVTTELWIFLGKLPTLERFQTQLPEKPVRRCRPQAGDVLSLEPDLIDHAGPLFPALRNVELYAGEIGFPLVSRMLGTISSPHIHTITVHASVWHMPELDGFLSWLAEHAARTGWDVQELAVFAAHTLRTTTHNMQYRDHHHTLNELPFPYDRWIRQEIVFPDYTQAPLGIVHAQTVQAFCHFRNMSVFRIHAPAVRCDNITDATLATLAGAWPRIRKLALPPCTPYVDRPGRVTVLGLALLTERCEELADLSVDADLNGAPAQWGRAVGGDCMVMEGQSSPFARWAMAPPDVALALVLRDIQQNDWGAEVDFACSAFLGCVFPHIERVDRSASDDEWGGTLGAVWRFRTPKAQRQEEIRLKEHEHVVSSQNAP